MGGDDQGDARAASPEPEMTSRPTATPTALPLPTIEADAPSQRSTSSKRMAEPTDAVVPTDSPDGPVDADDETQGEVDDRGGSLMPPPKRTKTKQQASSGAGDVKIISTEISPPKDDVEKETQRPMADAPSPKRQKTDEDVPPPPPPFGTPSASSGN
eukprot:12417843-Karenia_brevis.AAC.1